MPASKHMRDRARTLRRASTLSEQRLWNWLRNRRFKGFKFRRQVAIGRYVVDFFCHRLMLALEIDGAHHEQNWFVAYENARTEYLCRRGIGVIRIPSKLLACDTWLVEEMIEAAIRSRMAQETWGAGVTQV